MCSVSTRSGLPLLGSLRKTWWWSNQWHHPSGMFSLHRDKWRDDSTAKPSVAGRLGRKKQYYLLQLFKHCRQTVLVQAGSGENCSFCSCCCQMEQWKGIEDYQAHLMPKPVSAPCTSQDSSTATLPPTSMLWAHRALLALLVCTQTCIWHSRLPYNSDCMA